MIYITILWLLIIILTVILVTQINIKKNIFFCIFISISIVLFFLNLNQCISAAIDGCKLWYKAILPTTFPFVVICNLLIYYNGIELYSKFLGPIICKPLGLSENCSFPIIASILCGYPLGAKYCVDLYTMNYIEKNEYERVLNIASNAGPIFLIGSVGGTLLGNISLGYILLIGNYFSALLVGILLKKKKISVYSHPINKPNYKTMNFGLAIRDSVQNGINTILSIGGFIIIFSVIISILKNSSYINSIFQSLEVMLNLPLGTLYSLFLGSIEMTNGCNLISNLPLSLNIKLGIISFLCSFSGLAIIAQVSSFVSETKINYYKYIFFKLIQGIISFFITYTAIKIIPSTLYTSTIKTAFSLNFYSYFYPLIIITTLTILLSIINKVALR